VNGNIALEEEIREKIFEGKHSTQIELFLKATCCPRNPN
jgi:hypothetical protein